LLSAILGKKYRAAGRAVTASGPHAPDGAAAVVDECPAAGQQSRDETVSLAAQHDAGSPAARQLLDELAEPRGIYAVELMRDDLGHVAAARETNSGTVLQDILTRLPVCRPAIQILFIVQGRGGGAEVGVGLKEGFELAFRGRLSSSATARAGALGGTLCFLHVLEAGSVCANNKKRTPVPEFANISVPVVSRRMRGVCFFGPRAHWRD